MHIPKFIKWGLLAAGLVATSFFLYKKFFKKETKQLFKAVPLARKTITHIINATGTLEAEGTLNIGSLVSGIVEELHAKENQQVKKGQLLAKIDDGKKNTVVLQRAGTLAQAEATLAYQKQFYRREKRLYDAEQISQNQFEQAQQSHDRAQANVETQKAAHDQALLEFNNKKILSPIDGVVIKKNVSLRESVTTFAPPTVLYTIAADIRKMNVELEIDETDIGFLKIGQVAKLYFDTYPHKTFYGTISDISSAPIDNGASVVYKTTIKIDNKELLLKQGMTVHAKITVGKAEQVLAIPGHLFSLDKKLLEIVAKTKKIGFKKLSSDAKKAFKKQLKNKSASVKSLWFFENNALVQKPVEIGTTDKAFFEVVSGVDDSDRIIIDVDEPDAMAKMYKQLFGGGGLGGKK